MGCPAHDQQRWAVPPEEAPLAPGEPSVARDGALWRIRSAEAARQVLRARHQTRQAGFTAEYIPQGRMRHRPILISDGPQHDEQRSSVARFFAPRVVAERYTELMERCADRLLAQADAAGSLRLDELALHYAVEVTAEVVGLDTTPRKDTPERRARRIARMSHRLEAFFTQPPVDMTRADLGRSRADWLRAARNGVAPVVRFAVADVLPALRQRRRRPGDDVLSHLLAEGHSTTNILVECITYGTAGMVTTREFICMAAWHLLRDDSLRERYLAAEREERHAILHEVIRLEPVVGHLYRRLTEDLEVSHGDERWQLAAGDLVDVCIRDTNADPAAVGPEPLQLCPGRPMAPGVNAAAMSFGDGAHKCPGQPLAVWEADILLTRLLARRPRLVAEPRLGWDDLIAGYWLRDVQLALDHAKDER